MGKERLKKEVGYRLVGGSFNKQGNLYMRLGSHKTSRSLDLPTKILKVYTEALMGFSHVFSPDGLNNTLLSHGSVLESSYCGEGSGRYIPRTVIELTSL